MQGGSVYYGVSAFLYLNMYENRLTAVIYNVCRMPDGPGKFFPGTLFQNEPNTEVQI